MLGQFAFTPAFSLPVRLFLEAKFRDSVCGLPMIRNAFGVIQDINENYVTIPGSLRPRRRYHYRYALFSTSGFSSVAQDFAMAHQISLVDLSGDSFTSLRRIVRDAALGIRAAAERSSGEPLSVPWLRRYMRSLLGTAPFSASPTGLEDDEDVFTEAQLYPEAAREIDGLASQLRYGLSIELLIGFPAAPFIIPFAVSNKERFLLYADSHPSHQVRLRRSDHGDHAEWVAVPTEDHDAYELRFTLPQRLEAWIGEDEEQQLRRILDVKADFLAEIMIYYKLGGGVRACQLRYEPGQLRR